MPASVPHSWKLKLYFFRQSIRGPQWLEIVACCDKETCWRSALVNQYHSRGDKAASCADDRYENSSTLSATNAVEAIYLTENNVSPKRRKQPIHSFIKQMQRTGQALGY